MTDVTEHYGSADMVTYFNPTVARTWALVGPLGMLVSINLETGEMRFGENYSPAVSVLSRTWGFRNSSTTTLAGRLPPSHPERHNGRPEDCFDAGGHRSMRAA